MVRPNNSFKPTPHRGVNSVLCATLHAVVTPPQGGLTQALGRRRVSVQHPILGQLKIDQRSVVGALAVGDKSISLRIDPDDVALDQALSLATTIAASLSDYDNISKIVIARDLLETYNSGWNEYDEVQDNGEIKTITNPQISQSEFKDKLTLVSVSITGDSCVELWYSDCRLFWGHSIFVESLDGANFTNSQAQLFG